MQKHPFIVGITGGSGSGKSTFSHQLKRSFADDEMTLVSQDHYYLLGDAVPLDNNGVHNFDLPESIDYNAYVKDVAKLKAGIPVLRREYTFYKKGVEPRMLTFNPTPIIVVEGIFCMHFKEACDAIDYKIFLDADSATRLNRRIKRDQEERDFGLDDVMYRWQNHVTPVFDTHQDTYRSIADLIINNDEHYENELEKLVAYLKNKMEEL